MIRDRDRHALLQLRMRLMRLAFVADRYGEDLADFDPVRFVPAGGRLPGGRPAAGARVVLSVPPP